MRAMTTNTTETEDQVRTEILAAYRAQNRAMVEGRTDTLSELLADGFTAIHISGYQQDLAEWLDQIDSGRMTYDAIKEKSVDVEIKGETAVLTSHALVTATVYGTHRTWPLRSVTRYA